MIGLCILPQKINDLLSIKLKCYGIFWELTQGKVQVSKSLGISRINCLGVTLLVILSSQDTLPFKIKTLVTVKLIFITGCLGRSGLIMIVSLSIQSRLPHIDKLICQELARLALRYKNAV